MKSITKILLSAILSVSMHTVAQESSDELATKIEAMAKVGACYSPSFSPDGSEIVLISNISGTPQLCKMSS